MDRKPDITPAVNAAVPEQRLQELAEIIRAYNHVTENLQKSHESLNAQIDRLREQLASADAQLVRSRRLAALGEMAAGIAHEVRNPLAAIQLYAGMIAQDIEHNATAVPSQAVPLAPSLDAARKITSAVRGLNAIVNDVLTFARDISPRRLPVEVSPLFMRVLDTQKPAIDSACVGIRMNCAEDIRIDVDPDLMLQALANVVRNAVEAMAEQKTKTRDRLLTLEAAPSGGFVTIRIADTGPGIAAEHVDRIFNPFFTTRNTGTGLGLAIVHRIVDAHAGAIGVHNDPVSGGAVFELSLPVSTAVSAPMADDDAIAVGTPVASDYSRSLS